MPTELITLRHYGTLDEAEEVREVLEDENLNPLVYEESGEDNPNTGYYALQIPEDQYERAEEIVDALPVSEEEGALETLDEWQAEIDEAHEAFGET